VVVVDMVDAVLVVVDMVDVVANGVKMAENDETVVDETVVDANEVTDTGVAMIK
jgi:hypothetical protein